MTIWTFLPADGAVPITVMFVAFGLAAWANGSFFLGWGSEPTEGGAHPLKTVGAITFFAGLMGLITALFLCLVVGGVGIAVGALAIVYAMFFTALGIAEWNGWDLKPIANVCWPIAIWSLPFIGFAGFDKDLWMQLVMIVWTITFIAIWAVVYGKWGIKASWLGWLLLFVSIFCFLLPALRIATGSTWLILT